MKTRTILLSFLLGAVLTAQVEHNHDVPLKNWPAPLYWQPSQAESTAGRVHAEIRTPSPQAATPAGSLVFVAMTPCRVVDTRASQMFPNPFGPPSLSSGPARSFPIQSSTLCMIPSNAMAYSFNVTVVPPGPLGYLTIWPSGQAQPNAVTLDDYPTGDIRNNAAIVPAGTPNGSISVVVNGNTDLVIDINGYYAPSTGITLDQGTAGTPSLSFSGDVGTGIFSAGMGTLNLATGGVNVLTVRSDQDLDLAGNIRKGGTLFLHNRGTQNLGIGLGALAVTTTGGYNTASGNGALSSNTTGAGNTASGSGALGGNTTGHHNTAIGGGALAGNTTASFNTASGNGALQTNTSGSNNTASGFSALASNTIGSNNTASGYGALSLNTTGGSNTASGYNALFSNNAAYNTAVGESALLSNTTGFSNTAAGEAALYSNTSGGHNTAIGAVALQSNSTGSNNIAVGYLAGDSLTGSNNVDIGNEGMSSDGTMPNHGVIRIGTSGFQTSFFAAGIAGISVNNAATVMIDTTTGQLGALVSSRRYKADIRDMSDASDGLLKLRPVTFRYKQPYPDGSQPIDYGLIAEEVAEVYPDLVAKDKDGRIETVQYHKLIPMLLNELHKERRGRIQQQENQKEIIQSLQDRIEALSKTLEALASPSAK